LPRSGPKEKLFLMHPTRRSLYKLIAEQPGTYFYRLMAEMPKYDKKVSTATLLHHLTKLEEAGLISTEKIDGKRIYFPKNLRTVELERAYTLLKNDNAVKIFNYILNNDGCFQNELARALNVHHDTIHFHTDKLVDAELLSRKKEGKLVKFSIGRLGKEILEGSMILFSEAYVRMLISSLSDDCHFPEIISRTKDKLIVRVNCPGEDDITLDIDLSGWTVNLEEIAENGEDISPTNPESSEENKGSQENT
jgi:DNA-binding transcriptional ArsR family regulator